MHFLGFFSLFHCIHKHGTPGDGGHAPAAAGRNQVFNVTRSARELRQVRRWREDELVVTLVGPFGARRAAVQQHYFQTDFRGPQMSADIISCKTSERLAGLWDGWESPDGEEVESCTILTTDANKLVKLIRNRMPVIVAPGDYDLWLDPDIRKPAQVEPLLRLYPAEEMVVHPVSAGMNNPRHDDPKCVSVR